MQKTRVFFKDKPTGLFPHALTTTSPNAVGPKIEGEGVGCILVLEDGAPGTTPSTVIIPMENVSHWQTWDVPKYQGVKKHRPCPTCRTNGVQCNHRHDPDAAYWNEHP